MQSNGGVASPEVAVTRPACTLLSGPAGGLVAGVAYSSLRGYNDCIVVDMGGTSFDTCLILGKTPVITTAGEINRRVMALPMLDIHTIGAGGGTVAWIDAGNLLRMGPQSMGANPGPVCYDMGGEEATSTDSDLVLGYLNKDYFLGGKMKLNYDKACKTIKEKIAGPLKTDLIGAATAMYEVMNVNMITAIREISTQRGVDPREIVMLVAGGAGPVHAEAIALELGVQEIIIHKNSSAFCALGMLLSNLKHDFMRTYRLLFRDIDKNKFKSLFEEMEDEGGKILEAEKVKAGEIEYEHFIDVRYLGEYHEITLPITRKEIDAANFSAMTERFHQWHDSLYGYHLKEEGRPLELVNLRETALGRMPKPEFKVAVYRGEDSFEALKGRREIYLTIQKRFEEVEVYDGLKLRYGNRVVGPAIIEQPSTTILVLPEFNLMCDAYEGFTMYPKDKEAKVKERLLIRG